MKKSSRKRLLVSSVAMLLVAMLALGTATFAWFTSNPNASASGLQMKASASKGLVIQTATHKVVDADFWGHTDFLNCDSAGTASKTDSIEISPVSYDLATTNVLGNAYTVEAAADDKSAAGATKEVSDAPAGSVYTEDIACMLTGVTDSTTTDTLKMKGLTITTTSAVQKSGIRVAVEYNDKLIGVYAPVSTKNNYLTAPADYATGTTTYSAFTKTETSFAPFTGEVELGQVGTAGTDKVTVTVYLDGEDSNVYSKAISASNIVTKVEISLHVGA